MSLRKRACSSCVAAKRKCDSAFPACHRCAQRSLTCHYPFPLPRIFQDDEQNDLRVEDMLMPSLVALRDLQTDSTIGNPATGFCYTEKSLFESQVSSILSDNLASSDESVADELFIPSTTETLSRSGYDHSCNGTQWPVSFDRRILEFYPRVDDKKTWAFGVKTLLNQVDVFLRTGSAFFIHPQAQTENNLLPPLRVAYGVCSSYRLRAESEFPFFQQLLENEIENLMTLRSPDTLQELVAELCAMLLYYVIIHFGGTQQRGKLADKSETFLAQHTARVESLELATRQSTATLIEAELLSDEEVLNLWHLCESARKVVMVSYLAREIRHVLRFKTCYLLRHIVALPVSKKLIFVPGNKYGTGHTSSAQWQDVVSYDRFVRDWEDGRRGVADEFTYFLISMCKGTEELEISFSPSFSPFLS
ncbi:hypothetical protein N7474_003148 [Penicillium riverlandense]|uniref:uncharacterized protein n=1 Tax=Penicillium riverlandense TaxID=1903569 RepID=UPI002547198D|nr:uncharacterized protein N7474_003148 [Penicillium riverlandense]KAJ5826010.1 hypothetical protein N7474_003148 [Penicillium riverlandense]